MKGDFDEALTTVLEALEDSGLLLLSDESLPSVVSILVGEPVRGSWWGHPLGGLIYRVSSVLEDDTRVLTTRLLLGKVTYVHRRLWPAVVAIGSSRDAWQLASLSPTAAWLLAQTDAEGEVQSHDLPTPAGIRRKHVADAARELERRLLVHATEIHTPSGAHAKLLESWPHWIHRTQFADPLPTPAAARAQLEHAVEGLAAAVTSRRALHLPWIRRQPEQEGGGTAPARIAAEDSLPVVSED